MATLLNRFSASSRTIDQHGVAELLEAVSQRTMSCTDEERKELDDMVKRVREHKARPSPIQKMQQKLPLINIGNKQNDNSSNVMNSPIHKSPIRPSLEGLKSPLNGWGKDLFRSLSKLQNPLSTSSHSNSHEQQQAYTFEETEPDLLRGFGPTPTIVALPPEEVPSSEKDERQQDDSSSSEGGSHDYNGDDDDDSDGEGNAEDAASVSEERVVGQDIEDKEEEREDNDQ
jgi:hypothetical protein